MNNYEIYALKSRVDYLEKRCRLLLERIEKLEGSKVQKKDE